MQIKKIFAVAAAVVVLSTSVFAQDGRQKRPGRFHLPRASKTAWTFDEAMEQLALEPRDPYLQYVAAMLALRETGPDGLRQIEHIIGSDEFAARSDRRNQVDLFSLFTGALAVQESLQLDTMRGTVSPRASMRREFQSPNVKPPPVPEKGPASPSRPERGARPDSRSGKSPVSPRSPDTSVRPPALVSVAKLSAPTIKSHPWEQMLAGRKPAISSLALCVPADFYYVEFRSVIKLLEAAETSDLWGSHLLNQSIREARSQQASERLKKQLAIETSPLLRPIYDQVVDEVAIAGSDLYLREGSDVTLLFRLKQPALFKSRMDSYLATAEKSRPNVRRETGSYLGVDFVHLETPDREISTYSAYPTADLHVRSNSRKAFQGILEAIAGKDESGNPIRRLGDTSEFAYIATLMPRGAPEGDGFIYLSDPFIRRLVGPTLKLTESRRITCYNHLRMIGHAALLYQTERGKRPASLADLAQAKCSPGLFNEGHLTCPEGGKYSLSPDGRTGTCSHHGHAHFLTPCVEIPVVRVTTEEARAYEAFLQEYNSYWRTFFDPIALRIQITPERYRLETIILPLIDNSIYTGMASVLGGKPEPLDALPLPKRNIFSLALRFSKKDLFQAVGLDDVAVKVDTDKPTPNVPGIRPGDRMGAKQLWELMIAAHNYHDNFSRLPPAAKCDNQGKPLLSWRVLLLPYLEQNALYQQFHLDEPWDSEHNKKLIAKMPAVFRRPGSKADDRGMSPYVGLLGKETMFTGEPQGLKLPGDIPDGTSNTIFLVEADEKHEVVWTKPEDLKYDPAKPKEGLFNPNRSTCPVAFVDGSVRLLKDTIDPRMLRALFTRSGDETIDLPNVNVIEINVIEGRTPNRPDDTPLNVFGLGRMGLDERRVKEFVARGIGNQVGLHVYDASPLFDFNLPAALGVAMGTFSGRRGPLGFSELPFVFVAASLNSPVYLSVPVRDEKIVDAYLDHVDSFLVRMSRARQPAVWFSLNYEFYKFESKQQKEKIFRAFTIRLDPFKLRLFWARIGKGLYVASKPFILEDLVAAENGGDSAKIGKSTDQGMPAHGMVRIRPENWNQVLADFQLGWAENNREACLHNLGPLTGVARGSTANRGLAASDRAKGSAEIVKDAERLHTVHFFCPEGGEYVLAPDGKSMVCTVHGRALAPRQPVAPSGHSSLGKLLSNFKGASAYLTFLEDGLHAVVIIDRRQGK